MNNRTAEQTRNRATPQKHRAGNAGFYRNVCIVMMLMAVAVATFAQDHASDPTSARLREELAVVTDLGRLLGFILRMDTEQPTLALNRAQVDRLWQITEEIDRTDRLTPARSRAMMQEIEDTILSPAQLMHTDQLFLNREQSRVPGAGSGAAGSAGNPGSTGTPGARGGADSGGLIAAYQAGGPYNPIRDQARQLGQDFAALRTHLSKRRR